MDMEETAGSVSGREAIAVTEVVVFVGGWGRSGNDERVRCTWISAIAHSAQTAEVGRGGTG